MAVALGAGFLAGLLNAITFGGSFLTLPALLLLGLPPHVANGTNRVGILLAALVATLTFKSGGRLVTRDLPWFLLPSLAGAGLGAVIAADVPERWLELALATLMILMLGAVLLHPKRLLRTGTAPARARGLVTIAIFLAIGLFGGFVMAGCGLLLLFGLVLHAGHDLVIANGLKNLLVLAFTLPALAVFAWRGQVDWMIGLWMAIGQCAGAWVSSRFALEHARADVWIQRLLVVVLAATAVYLVS